MLTGDTKPVTAVTCIHFYATVHPVIYRPYIKKFVPWYAKGNQAVENLAGVRHNPDLLTGLSSLLSHRRQGDLLLYKGAASGWAYDFPSSFPSFVLLIAHVAMI